MSDKKSCYKCAYKGSVAGSVHLSCTFNFTGADKPLPEGDTHGILNGWYDMPLQFDPTWMKEECPQHAEVADPMFKLSTPDFMALLNKIRK